MLTIHAPPFPPWRPQPLDKTSSPTAMVSKGHGSPYHRHEGKTATIVIAAEKSAKCDIAGASSADQATTIVALSLSEVRSTV